MRLKGGKVLLDLTFSNISNYNEDNFVTLKELSDEEYNAIINKSLCIKIKDNTFMSCVDLILEKIDSGDVFYYPIDSQTSGFILTYQILGKILKVYVENE